MKGHVLLHLSAFFYALRYGRQGIATIQLNFFFVNASGNSVYGFNSVTYNFQSAEVPEPMTRQCEQNCFQSSSIDRVRRGFLKSPKSFGRGQYRER
jgi:hypothetical protein